MGRTFHQKYAGQTDNVNAGIFMDMWKSLCDAHPSLASYTVIGHTYENREILIFRIGNPNGGAVMWDASLHGWEDILGEVEYKIAEWLLTSGTPEAQRILDGNYVLFVPDINHDSVERGNRNFAECANSGNNSGGGVDLNRNFVTGWGRAACGTGSYGLSSGASAGSEPETQAMRNAFSTYKPKVYLNGHYGGGPSLTYGTAPATGNLTKKILDRVYQLEPDIGTYWSITSGGSVGGGMIGGDAQALAGANVWQWEMATNTDGPMTTCPNPTTTRYNPFTKVCESVGRASDAYMHTAHSIEDVYGWFFPRALPLFRAMCEAVETTAPPTQYTLTINLTGGKGWTDPLAGTYTYQAGTVVSVRHFQNAGWKFDYWQLDGANAGSGDPINVLMNGNHVLQAMYLPDTGFTVTVNSQPQGVTITLTEVN